MNVGNIYQKGPTKRIMTTQELIETLQKFPPEATVKIIQNDISGDDFLMLIQ